MKKSMLILAVLAQATLSLFGYTSNELDWKSNAADGNLASAANWSNVPSGVTDISYNLTDDTGYWGKFMIGSKTLNLYISSPFTFDRLYFQGSNSKYNIDLGGNTLTLRGAATYEFTTNESYPNQKIVVKNGNIAFSNSTRREFRIQGSGNAMTVAGTEEAPVTISGGSFIPTVLKGGELVFSNTVFSSGAKKVQINSSGSKMSFIGPKTSVSCSDSDFLGVGSTASSNTMVIAEGAKVAASAIRVGVSGVSNRMDVVSSGKLVSLADAPSGSGIEIGGVGSAGTVFNVDGGIVALTNTLFSMGGASAGSRTLMRIANGADVCAQFVSITNVGNCIEIDDAKLTVRTCAQFPQTGDDSVCLVFSGSRPLLVYEDVPHGSVARAFSFGAGATLSFSIPVGGYAEAPIKSANGIVIENLSACSIDAVAFRGAGGQVQVLMDAGSGIISIDAASQALIRSAAGDKCAVKLSGDQKTLLLTPKNGFVILVR